MGEVDKLKDKFKGDLKLSFASGKEKHPCPVCNVKLKKGDEIVDIAITPSSWGAIYNHYHYECFLIEIIGMFKGDLTTPHSEILKKAMLRKLEDKK